MKENDDDRLVTAATFANAPEANIALGMLRANGIPCILDNEIAYDVFGIQLLPEPGIRLLVHARHLDAAAELLKK